MRLRVAQQQPRGNPFACGLRTACTVISQRQYSDGKLL
jgi:hypothetical protein